MIYFIYFIITLIVSVVAGIGEALRIKDVEKYSTAWHWLQFFERAGILLVGILLSNFDFLQSIFLVILFASVFWTIYDGLINIIAREEDFFDVSATSKAFTEKFSQWYVKLPLTLLLLTINLIVKIQQRRKRK